ncbi:zinc-dependent alcohol dehydrogenase [Polynucleobacter antarcticus]|uniref:zinc-dependent alcohol dehydrogenase n=1 Tax=Polynucleobacter antarcticus TaxID=1743162 RepID=UPI0020C5B623|nr:zinc-binding alcohol dehydrogenase [Polynucleobacter antarcticus]
MADTSSNSPDTLVSQSLWYVAPERAELRTEVLGPLADDAVQVRSLFGALSRGTESLVYRGLVPETEYTRMRAPFMDGTFPFPVKYGYSNVGRIEQGPPSLIGQLVFALMPHQTLYQAKADSVCLIPSELKPERAVLAANMETALNAVWDAAPGPGDRVVVVGGGVIGCLVAFLCAHLPGAEVTLVDTNSERATVAHALGAQFSLPTSAPVDSDVVIHCSGTASGLATALMCAGDEATVLELSWYGSASVSVPLGGAFHSRQIRLQSSQVGHISASRRPRWNYHRRLSAALEMLNDPRLDVLLTPAIEFNNLPSRLPEILGQQSDSLCCLIRYP